MTLKALLLADLARQWRANGSDATPSTWRHIAGGLVNNRYLPVVLVRLATELEHRRLGVPARLVSMANQVLFGVEAALRSEIGPGLYFPHTGGIVLGAQRIGSNATIYHGVTLGAAVLDVAYTEGMRPVVGDNVVLAAGAKLLGGITVGNGAVVGANAVVVKDVDENTVVGGVPAVVISTRSGQESW
jgi:serine O-acetyltransferase